MTSSENRWPPAAAYDHVILVFYFVAAISTALTLTEPSMELVSRSVTLCDPVAPSGGTDGCVVPLDGPGVHTAATPLGSGVTAI
jgi:hypothetical protein